MSTPAPGGAAPRDEVWVWLPRDRERRLLPAAAELLYEAGALARRLGAELVAVGDLPPDGDEPGWLARWGVGRTLTLGRAEPPHPVCSGGASPLRALASQVRPRATLFLADAFGRAVAPLFAGERGAVYVPGITSLTSDGERFVAARPTLGEQYEALVAVGHERTLVATLLPGAVGDHVRPRGEAGEAPAAPVPAGMPMAVPEALPHLLPPDPETLDIADAERIVAFGRGAFHADAVALVERLAKALGAAVAGTRPAADEGWLPFSRQVGLTGAIVHPRLYVAVGISGAPYHMVGIKDPETLVAINKDPEAPIFASAHLGIVGDLYDVLPALLERLERGEGLPAPGDGSAGGVRRPGPEEVR